MITKAEAGRPHWESCGSHTDSVLDGSSLLLNGGVIKDAGSHGQPGSDRCLHPSPGHLHSSVSICGRGQRSYSGLSAETSICRQKEKEEVLKTVFITLTQYPVLFHS